MSLSLESPLVIGFIVGGLAVGLVVYLVMSLNRTNEKATDLAQLVKGQGEEIAILRQRETVKDERVNALEKILRNNRARHGSLYETSIQELQETKNRVDRLLKMGVRDVIDALWQSDPSKMREIFRELEIDIHPIDLTDPQRDPNQK